MNTETKHAPAVVYGERIIIRAGKYKGATLEVTAAHQEWVDQVGIAFQQRDELAEALRAIVALDDGDKPDLWHFEAEFKAARAVLASIQPKE